MCMASTAGDSHTAKCQTGAGTRFPLLSCSGISQASSVGCCRFCMITLFSCTCRLVMSRLHPLLYCKQDDMAESADLQTFLQELPPTAQQHELTYKEMRCDARKFFDTVKLLKLASWGVVQLQGIPAFE